MSYRGLPPDGPFIQGLSTSNVQDTWESEFVSYSSTNKTATLQSPYSGDWRLSTNVDRSTATDDEYFFSNYRPDSGADFSQHAILKNWDGGTGFAFDEALVNYGTTMKFILFNNYRGDPVWVYSRFTTLCELFI